MIRMIIGEAIREIGDQTMIDDTADRTEIRMILGGVMKIVEMEMVDGIGEL